MNSIDISTVPAFLMGLQERITSAIAEIDGRPFVSDEWQKEPGEALQGNGITKILEQGRVFERAGCGFSHVRGATLPPSATQHRPNIEIQKAPLC
ncbi:MAG: coproporphyrinogen III oxidase, partial [Polaromonas sp.]